MYESLLSNVARHVTLSELDKHRLCRYFKSGTVARGQKLVEQGEVQQRAAYIVKGCMIAYHTDEAGRDHLIRFALEDWWVVDITSFDMGGPALYTIEALEDCHVLFYSSKDKASMLNELPAMERYYRVLYQSALATYQQRVVNQISRSAESRYTELINRYPTLEQRLSQKVIASYLGITAQHLSRIKRDERTRLFSPKV